MSKILSIVTISFDQASYIERCLDSVISQKTELVEYIVIDAGSTDGSRDIIDKYRKNIDSVIFEADDGPADGLNKGAAVATGDYLAFLNSDDFYFNGALENIVNAIKRRERPDALTGVTVLVDKNEIPIRLLWSPLPFTAKGYALGLSRVIQQSTVFKRDTFVGVGGFNPKNRVSWDAELFIDFSLAGYQFENVNSTWSAFRMHQDSITGSSRFQKSFEEIDVKLIEKIYGRRMRGGDKLKRAVLQKVYGLVLRTLSPKVLKSMAL